MTYNNIEEIAKQLVLYAMGKDEKNVEDLDNPVFGSVIANFVNAFYKDEGIVSGSLLVNILRDKYNVNIKV